MSKDALITELLALPDADQRHILALLQDRLDSDDLDSLHIGLSSEQERELDSRLDTLDHRGSRGRPWSEVYSQLTGKSDAPAHD